jgi:hypothetical protein
MRLFATIATLTFSTLVLQACGSNCQQACARAFDESQCAVKIPGEDADDLFSECTRECTVALRTPGDTKNYDPDERNVSGKTVTLDNEQQAAVWMDCVEGTSCEDLNDGYCSGGGL